MYDYCQFSLVFSFRFTDISFTFRSRLVMRNIDIIVLWICVVQVMESLSLRDPEIDKWTENGDIENEEIKRNIEVGLSS